MLTLASVGVSVVGLAILHLMSPLLLGWLIDQKYAPALHMVLPAGLVMVNSQINQFHYLLLQGQHNSAGMVWVMLTVAGIKTLGGVVAASISWNAFVGWLLVAPLVCGWAGRWLIMRMTFAHGQVQTSDAPSLKRGPDATSHRDET